MPTLQEAARLGFGGPVPPGLVVLNLNMAEAWVFVIGVVTAFFSDREHVHAPVTNHHSSILIYLSSKKYHVPLFFGRAALYAYIYLRYPRS